MPENKCSTGVLTKTQCQEPTFFHTLATNVYPYKPTIKHPREGEEVSLTEIIYTFFNIIITWCHIWNC